MVLDKHDNDDGGISFLKKSFGLYPLKKNDFFPHARKILRHSILVWRSSIMNHRLDIGPARTCTKSPDSYVCKHNLSIYFFLSSILLLYRNDCPQHIQQWEIVKNAKDVPFPVLISVQLNIESSSRNEFLVTYLMLLFDPRDCFTNTIS